MPPLSGFWPWRYFLLFGTACRGGGGGGPFYYVMIMLLVFKLIPVTLTAAGIAGFILSIGMAVDANILIAERTQEELRRGKDIVTSINEGFTRAWLSIRDSNISSIITGIIPLFGSAQAWSEGFALTFVLGVWFQCFLPLP